MTDMDRRQFFRQALSKGAKAATQAADRHVSRRASRWLRPPHALDELEFLLACTRCDDCIRACPDQVIFPLSARLGAQVVGTPALDLLNKPCRLCADWPCVAACTTGALRLPAADAEPAPPRLAVAQIDPGACLPYAGPECGACRDSCPVPGALLWRGETPHIDPGHCVGCAQCRASCIAVPNAILIRSPQDSAPAS